MERRHVRCDVTRRSRNNGISKPEVTAEVGAKLRKFYNGENYSLSTYAPGSCARVHRDSWTSLFPPLLYVHIYIYINISVHIIFFLHSVSRPSAHGLLLHSRVHSNEQTGQDSLAGGAADDGSSGSIAGNAVQRVAGGGGGGVGQRGSRSGFAQDTIFAESLNSGWDSRGFAL